MVGLVDEWSRAAVGAVLDVARAARTVVVTLDDALAAGGRVRPAVLDRAADNCSRWPSRDARASTVMRRAACESSWVTMRTLP